MTSSTTWMRFCQMVSFCLPKYLVSLYNGSHEPSSRQHTREKEIKVRPAQHNPVHTLPPEILQQIASYLSRPSQASLSLASRYICYSVGREALYNYLHFRSLSKAEKRQNIEIVERAFPSHWYCVWCDKFHEREAPGRGGPRSFYEEKVRECQEKSGFLHVGKEYVLCWHHVRLAVNAALWGEEFGIPLEDFAFQQERSIKFCRKTVRTFLDLEARISQGCLLLHSDFQMVMPRHLLRSGHAIICEMLRPSILPQVVVGHRHDVDGHTGLKTSIMQALRNPGKQRGMLCSTCATDYVVTARLGDANEITLNIATWRNLSNGRSPFDAAWRAHTEIGSSKPGFAGDILRMASIMHGDIKKAFGETTFRDVTDIHTDEFERALETQSGLRRSLEQFRSSLSPLLNGVQSMTVKTMDSCA